MNGLCLDNHRFLQLDFRRIYAVSFTRNTCVTCVNVSLNIFTDKHVFSSSNFLFLVKSKVSNHTGARYKVAHFIRVFHITFFATATTMRKQMVCQTSGLTPLYKRNKFRVPHMDDFWNFFQRGELRLNHDVHSLPYSAYLFYV